VLYSTVQYVSSLHIIDARLQKSAKTSQIICRNNSSAFSLLRSSMTGIMSKTMIWSSCLSNQMKRYVMVDKTIARRCFASTPLTGVEREQALGTLAKGPMSWKQVSNQSPKMLYCSLFRLIFLEKSPLWLLRCYHAFFILKIGWRITRCNYKHLRICRFHTSLGIHVQMRIGCREGEEIWGVFRCLAGLHSSLMFILSLSTLHSHLFCKDEPSPRVVQRV